MTRNPLDALRSNPNRKNHNEQQRIYSSNEYLRWYELSSKEKNKLNEVITNWVSAIKSKKEAIQLLGVANKLHGWTQADRDYEINIDTIVSKYLLEHKDELTKEDIQYIEAGLDISEQRYREINKLIRVIKSEIDDMENQVRGGKTYHENVSSVENVWWEALQIARAIDATYVWHKEWVNSWRIGKAEIQAYTKWKPLKLQAAIINTWNANWERNGGDSWMKVTTFARLLKKEMARAEQIAKTMPNWTKDFETTRTSQYFSNTTTNLWGEKITIEKAFENVNKSSFVDVVSRLNYRQLRSLYTKAYRLAMQYNYDGKMINYNPFNIWPLKKLFTAYGYKPDGFFGWEEMWSLMDLVQSYVVTEQRVYNLSTKNLFSLVLDFDKDGWLTNKKNFYVWENQMRYHVFKSLTSDGPEVLLQNMGYKGWVRELRRKLRNNLIVEQNTFKRRLAALIQQWVKPWEVVKKWWVEKAYAEIYSKQEKLTAKANNLAEKFIARNNLKKYHIDKNALTMEAVAFAVGKWQLWAWASFDMRKLNAFFDSLQVGFVEKWWKIIPWVTLSKTLLEGKGYNVTWSLTNLFIPSLTAYVSTDTRMKEFTKAFPRQFKWDKVSFSAYASLSTLASGFGVEVRKVDETTKEWIEKMVNKMAGLLKNVSWDIRRWRTFEWSVFARFRENKEVNKKIYYEMKRAYDMYAKWKSYAGRFMKDMMNGYLDYYRMQLYKNAEGTKVTRLGAWIALVAGFLPIPYLTMWGESIHTKWKKVIHSMNRERKITYTADITKRLWAKTETYKWHKVIAIPHGDEYQISSSLGPVQAEWKNGKLYLWWNVWSFVIDEYTTHSGVTKTIIIWNGVRWKNGRYISTETTSIKSWVNVHENTTEKEVKMQNTEVIRKTETIRKEIFNIWKPDILKHSKTKWMMKLQRMIYAFRTKWKNGVDAVWRQFKTVVNYHGFMEYAKEKWVIQEAKNLKNHIKHIKTNDEKILILQSIESNFMKKSQLKIDNHGNVNIWKSVIDYDKEHNRSAFFDQKFREKFPHLVDNIQKARKEWYKYNGQSKTYKFTSVADGSVAFTWVESKKPSWRKNISWVMPYVGMYEIASTWNGHDIVEIKAGIKEKYEVIRKLPKSVLKNIQKLLASYGKRFRKLSSVAYFVAKWGDKNIQIQSHLWFAKMWECLNDAVILKDLIIKHKWKALKIWATTASEVYDYKVDVTNWGIFLTGEAKRKKKPKKPKPEEKDDSSSTTNADDEWEIKDWNDNWNDNWNNDLPEIDSKTNTETTIKTPDKWEVKQTWWTVTKSGNTQTQTLNTWDNSSATQVDNSNSLPANQNPTTDTSSLDEID